MIAPAAPRAPSNSSPLSLRQLIDQERLHGPPGVDLAASAGTAVSAEYRRQRGTAPTKQRVAGEQCKVSVYPQEDHAWINELLRKYAAGEVLPQAPHHQPVAGGAVAAAAPAGGGWGGGGGPVAQTARPGGGGGGGVTEYACSGCGITKPRGEFSKNMQKGNKSVIRCKVCVNGPQIAATVVRCNNTRHVSRFDAFDGAFLVGQS